MQPYDEAQNANAAGAVAIIVVNNRAETESRSQNFVAMYASESSGVTLPMLFIPQKAGPSDIHTTTRFRSA